MEDLCYQGHLKVDRDERNKTMRINRVTVRDSLSMYNNISISDAYTIDSAPGHSHSINVASRIVCTTEQWEWPRDTLGSVCT